MRDKEERERKRSKWRKRYKKKINEGIESDEVGDREMGGERQRPVKKQRREGHTDRGKT